MSSGNSESLAVVDGGGCLISIVFHIFTYSYRDDREVRIEPDYQENIGKRTFW